MSNVFNYNEAELLFVIDTEHPKVTDFDNNPLPIKVYRYKVADDIAIDILVTQHKHWRAVYVRNVSLDKNGNLVTVSDPARISSKEEAKRYLRNFNMVSKRKKFWVQDIRHNLKFEGNEPGYL